MWPSVTYTFSPSTIMKSAEFNQNFTDSVAALEKLLQKGFLANGKFVVTDTGSGINIAIKTLAGTDPSASDRVKIRIGDTMREITGALSRTIADGSDWGRAGSTELNGKLIPWFLYAVWDSGSSVVGLSISRAPYGKIVSDFSATTNDDDHLIGYADYATSDDAELIGMFEAQLSAGASYAWTLPTFTNNNLIQGTVFPEKFYDWEPVWTGFSSAPTGGVKRYQIRGRMMPFTIQNMTPGTSNASTMGFTLPFRAGASNNSNNFFAALGTDNGASQPYCARWEMPGAGGRVVTVQRDFASSSWTSSGSKRTLGNGFIEI